MIMDRYARDSYERHMIEAGEWYLRSLHRRAVSISAHIERCLVSWPDLDQEDLRSYLVTLLLWSVAGDAATEGVVPNPDEQAMIERVAARMRTRIRRRLQRAA